MIHAGSSNHNKCMLSAITIRIQFKLNLPINSVGWKTEQDIWKDDKFLLDDGHTYDLSAYHRVLLKKKPTCNWIDKKFTKLSSVRLKEDMLFVLISLQPKVIYVPIRNILRLKNLSDIWPSLSSNHMF